MAIKKSEISTLSTRYAKALFDAASQAKALENVDKDLKTVSGIIAENPDFAKLLSSGSVIVSKMKAIFADIASKAKVSEITANFLGVLAENKRGAILPEISKKFSRLLLDESGTVEAEVISFRKLDEKKEKEIQSTLEKSLGKKVVLSNKVDAKILGGLKVKVGSQMFDDSISSKLEALKQNLVNN